MGNETLFGKTKDGKETHLYELVNRNGMKAYVSDFGATLVRLLVPDKDGKMVDVVLGYDDATEYENRGGALGATVGRSANRIGGARIEIGGVTYELEKNDNGNNLHSGEDYYQKRIWNVEKQSENEITFLLHSPDGDQGYPGALDMHVTYTLDDENALNIHYEAVPDKDTVINMTNHSYFNLNGHNSGTALGHKVMLDADCFTPADAESIPTGEIRSVEGTPMDFRSPKRIGDEIDSEWDQLTMVGGYDHNWCLNDFDGNVRLVACAVNPSGTRTMKVYTDLPGVQFYTANGLSERTGKGGANYGRRGAFCLETQYYPDTANEPDFPSAVFGPDREYHTSTIFRFE